MAQLKTLQQYKDYLKIRCGYPVINVEVDDTQFDQIAEDTIQFFQRHNIIEGSYLEYAIFTVSAGVSSYNLSGQNVQGVFDMELSIGIDGINTLFSPSHELLYSDFVRKGSVLGTNTPDYSPGLTLTSYDVAMLFLKEIKNHFGRGFTVQYNTNTETLHIIPTPNDNMQGVVYLYRKEDAVNLYNHELVKDLGYAKSLVYLGQNQNKYAVTMPDGITLNGAALLDRGTIMEAEIKEKIRLESAPPDFFVG